MAIGVKACSAWLVLALLVGPFGCARGPIERSPWTLEPAAAPHSPKDDNEGSEERLDEGGDSPVKDVKKRRRSRLALSNKQGQNRHRVASHMDRPDGRRTIANTLPRSRRGRQETRGDWGFGHDALPRGNGKTPMVLQWPLPASGITSTYGPRRNPVNGRVGFHYGVDLQADYGDQVAAAGDGLVLRSGWRGGHGLQVVVAHRHGFRTSYSHLSQISVAPGARVGTGEPIGLVGNSGRSTGPHLHLEVQKHGRNLDPLEVIGVPLPRAAATALNVHRGRNRR